MKRAKFIIIILSALCFFVTCVKKETVYPTYYFGQEFRDYVIYKPGSYWIYQELATGEIDSIYLYKQSFYINKSTQKIDYNYEGISESKISSLHDTLTYSGNVLGKNPCGEYKAITVNGFVNSNVNYFEGEIGYSALTASYTFYTEKKDSIEFNKLKFFEVKIFENAMQIFSNQPFKTYYSKHVGLVRTELFNGQVWNLIRYKVSQ